MRISDWSSDVCSSDLRPINPIFSMLTAPLFVYKADRESIPHVGRFRISVEIDSILALLALAVAGTFDAPKRHVVVKARRRQIDHSQAAADIQAEMVGVLKRACANTRRQTEIGIVGDGQGFFVIRSEEHT